MTAGTAQPPIRAALVRAIRAWSRSRSALAFARPCRCFQRFEVSRAYSADHEARWGTPHCAPRPGLQQAYAIATRLVILHSLASQANGPTVRAELEELQRMERGLRRDGAER